MTALGRDGLPPDICEYADLDPRHPQYRPPGPLPDPYPCLDPWCRSAGQGAHQHGTRPDGRRV